MSGLVPDVRACCEGTKKVRPRKCSWLRSAPDVRIGPLKEGRCSDPNEGSMMHLRVLLLRHGDIVPTGTLPAVV